jgi:hypothetical protein
MSYLRGPFTRAELLRLKPDGDAVSEGTAAPDTPAVAPGRGVPAASGAGAGVADSPGPAGTATPELAPDESPIPPQVFSDVPVKYLDPGAPWSQELGVVLGGRRLEAGLAARVRMLFDDQRGNLRHEEEWEAVFFPLKAPLEPESARTVDHDRRDFRDTAPGEPVYALPEPSLEKAEFFKASEKAIKEHLYASLSLTLFRNPALKLYSRAGETEDAFRARCLEAAEERADTEAEKLRTRYEAKLKTAEGRVAQAERRVRELEVDTSQRRQQELISGAGEVLSMFLGGRRRTRSLSGIASRRSQTRRTQERLRSAEEKLEDYEEAILELEDELSEELEEIWAKWRDTAEELESFEVGLEKTDIHLEDLILFWAPVG